MSNRNQALNSGIYTYCAMYVLVYFPNPLIIVCIMVQGEVRIMCEGNNCPVASS